jgi:AcrR family transcriptional regulator
MADVRAARAANEADIRATLLIVAATVLSEEGYAALTTRRLAEAVNASTKVIYTHFGGKEGLLDALYLHAFYSLMQAFDTHAGELKSLSRLRGMTETYRNFALAEPALYSVMFGDLGRAWEAPLASRRKAWQSFETLRATVGECLPREREDDALRVTYLLWAVMHGVVSLELRKLIGGSQDGALLFRQAVEAVCQTHGIPY